MTTSKYIKSAKAEGEICGIEFPTLAGLEEFKRDAPEPSYRKAGHSIILAVGLTEGDPIDSADSYILLFRCREFLTRDIEEAYLDGRLVLTYIGPDAMEYVLPEDVLRMFKRQGGFLG